MSSLSLTYIDKLQRANADRPIDLTAYNRRKREGEAMPSRFSRTHYKTPA